MNLLGVCQDSAGVLLGVSWGSVMVNLGSVGVLWGQTWVRRVFISMKLFQALQMTSPNNLSKWALQCLFTFWNITILDCNSNYLVLYSILFFDTNVYNEY